MRDEMNSKSKEHGKMSNDYLLDLHYTDMVLAGEYYDLQVRCTCKMKNGVQYCHISY